MSPEQVRAKLAHVADRVAELRQLPVASFDEFMADPRNLDAALHRLQTAIQAVVAVLTADVDGLRGDHRRRSGARTVW